MSVPYQVAAGAPIHGEIVSWGIPAKTKVPFSAVTSALAAAGFDTKTARVMLPANAFARACNRLAERNLIRKVQESPTEVRFQFTREERDGDGLSYSREAILTLSKTDGTVACDNAALADRARLAIAEEMDTRNCSDLHNLICKLFEKNADLFPIRDQGGVYFVPAAFHDFLERVDQFTKSVCGINVRRYPVPAGFAAGDRSVAESVEDGMMQRVQEHLRAIEGFDNTTRDSTLEKTVDRINQTRFKLEAYAQFLGDKREEIEAAIGEARKALRAKVAELGKATEVPEPPVVVGPITVQAPAFEPVVLNAGGIPLDLESELAAEEAENALDNAETEARYAYLDEPANEAEVRLAELTLDAEELAASAEFDRILAGIGAD